MLSAAVLSDLIGRIYDCALDPARWPDTIARLHLELGYANASLSLIDMRSGRTPLNITSGVDEHWLKTMNNYGSEIIEQWGGTRAIQSHPFNRPAVLSRMNPDSLKTSRYRIEWAAPQGLIDSLAILVSCDEEAVGSLAMGRHYSVGTITDRDIEIASLFVPHLQRAIMISRLLDLKTATAATFDAVIDELTAAVFLVDAEQTILHANAAARQVLAHGHLLRGRENSLRLRHPGADKALGIALRQAASEGSGIARKGFNVPLPANNGSRRVLHILPLRPQTERSGVLAAAVAAVFVAPALRRSGAAIEIVTDLFDLTPAEARVLGHVAAGKNPAAIAAALDLGEATVRTHLLRLFDKTGTHRQAELAALVSSFEVPVGA